MRCEHCGSSVQVGVTDINKIVCYNCFHDIGGFGYEWSLITDGNESKD